MTHSPQPGRRNALLGALILSALAAAGSVLWRSGQIANTPTRSAPSPVATHGPNQLEYSNFAARHERSPGGDRLSVSLRLRTVGEGILPCFVFVVARSDEGDGKGWAIWPEQANGRAVTASGRFHGATPSSGFGMILTSSWEWVTSTQEESIVHYDSVVVYVVAPDGRVLLSRPFRV